MAIGRLDLWKDLSADIKKAHKLSPSKKIDFILEKEYGYLLPDTINNKWEIKDINPKSVSYNTSYYRKLPQVKYPNEPDVPLGVYLQDGKDKFRLIDGYHRFISNQNNKSIKYSLKNGRSFC